jgi:hypothetical protein
MKPAKGATSVLLVLGTTTLALLGACAQAGSGGAASGASGTAATASDGPNASSPAPSTESGSTDPILRGERQVVIVPIPSFESILAVDAAGRLTLIDGDSDKDLFVLAPVGGGRHQIKTAKAEAGGEPSCMGLKNNGANPLTVVAAACDVSRKGQLFSIQRQQAKTSNGLPTYAIAGDGGVYLRQSRDGLIAEELGDAKLDTTFYFADNGPSTLPKPGN